jgi:hypothetical protein
MVCTMEYFEVIDIVDNTTPYPTLLGLYWAFDNQIHHQLEDPQKNDF